MRGSGTGIVDALVAAPESGLIVRQFVWLTVKDRVTGVANSLGWWTGSVPITLNVLSPFTGLSESRTYEADGALLTVGKVPLTADLRIRHFEFRLDKNNDRVKQAIRDWDPRLAQVEYHRVTMSVTSRQPTAMPRARFIGNIDGTPITRPAGGGEGTLVVKCISPTAEATIRNPARRNHVTQQLRDGDEHSLYADECHLWEVDWGEDSTNPKGKR